MPPKSPGRFLSAAVLCLLVLLPAAINLAASRERRGTVPRLVSNDLLADLAGAQAGTQAEPYIDANPEKKKELLAGWQENRFVEGSAQALIVARSTNGGKSWREELLPGLTEVDGGPWPFAADPWVEYGVDGRAHYAALVGSESIDTAITVSTSPDGGVSWGAPVLVTRDAPPNFADKPALTVDTRDNSKYRGNVYVTWDVNVLSAAGNSFSAQDIYMARSTDGGASFEAPQRVRAGLIGGGGIFRVGPGGRVYLIFTGEGSISRYAIYFSQSKNGGRRWSKPRVVADILGEGVADLRDGFSLASFEVDGESGALYVAWQDARFEGVEQIAFISSEDRGKNWSEPRMVASVDPGQPAFTPGVAVDGRGRVAVGYYVADGRQADYLVSVSEDGGTTFDKTFRMTRKSFDLDRAADSSRGRFLGDYVGLTGNKKHFHALWISTRRAQPGTGVNGPDVWTARTR